MTRKLLLGFAVLLVVAGAVYFRLHHAPVPLEIAYAANRQVTLQSTTAQVREPITTVSYGDRLEVLQRFQDQVKVRTTTGLTGWVNERDLLSTDVWQKAADLGKRTSSLPVQARGHTRALTNLRIDAGRDGPCLGIICCLRQDSDQDENDGRPHAATAPKSPRGRQRSTAMTIR